MDAESRRGACGAALLGLAMAAGPGRGAGEEWWKPYSPPCTEREEVFEFTEKPSVRLVGPDRYEIRFAVKGNCDVAAAIVDAGGKVVRHLGAGVLGANAPEPFRKSSLAQTIFWNGKDDLGAYVREPGKLRARVQLGLKPTFDKLLGDAGPKNLFGYLWGVAVAQDGAYVFGKGSGNGQIHVRKFDRDGNYLGTIFPPPATMPHEKLEGMGFIEYEPGKRALHGPDVYQSVAVRGYMLPEGVEGGRGSVLNCQPIVVGDRLYFANPGAVRGVEESRLHYMRTDGATDAAGMKGLTMLGTSKGHMQLPHQSPRLAASPDGRYVYLSDAEATDARVAFYVVWRRDVTGGDKAVPFLGTLRKPGSDNASFGHTMGIDCDPRGRIYVCDAVNNRIQVYGGDAAHLKTIQVERPYLVQVHRKTGAIYVLQIGRVGGRSVCQFAKLASLDNPAVEYRVEVPNYSVLALDHWSAPPRFWMGGGSVGEGGNWEVKGGGPSVRLFEERGGGLKLLADFDGEAAKAGGAGYMGRWGGGEQGGSGIGGKLNCDPVRGVAYYGSAMFDLKTGALLGSFKIAGSTYDDFSFDRRGRMHIHFNPGFYMPGVGRVDPSRARESVDQQTGRKVFLYPEMPYDYGEERTGKWETPWKGILPVRDQPGAKFFQDGIGVDMTGNVAVESNIYYVPRMEETGFETVVAGMDEKGRREEPQTGDYSFEKFMRDIQDREKRGEEVYSIRRQPGVPLHGATIWTFDQAGELREKCAATLGNLVNGVRIDEAGRLYFVNNRPRIVAGKGFLNGRGGMFGVPDEKRNRSLGFMAGPFTGTLAKTAGRDVRAVAMKAAVPLDQPIERPGDVCGGYSEDEKMWIEGAEWLYAGASPIVYGGCSCPTQRFHLDWFKRSFVPEGYRHSIGVLDANGNLIMHIGRYGNYDSGFGPKSRIPVGGDQIGMIQARFISGTDDCLAFTDWCERIVVLALNYHAEESAPVGAQ